MGGFTKVGMDFKDVSDAILKAVDAARDSSRVLGGEAHEYVAQQVEKNVATSGAHSGQSFTFAGEENYQRQKTARYGAFYGERPLLVPPDRAKLIPSLTRKAHPDAIVRVRPGMLEIGSRSPVARALFETGGVGPRGERFRAS